MGNTFRLAADSCYAGDHTEAPTYLIWGKMLIPVVSWLVLVFSFVVAARSILDAAAKSEEAARAQREDLSGVKEPRGGKRKGSTRKGMMEAISAFVGIASGLAGVIVASINLVNPPAPYEPLPYSFYYVSLGVWFGAGILIAVISKVILDRAPKPLG